MTEYSFDEAIKLQPIEIISLFAWQTLCIRLINSLNNVNKKVNFNVNNLLIKSTCNGVVGLIMRASKGEK